MLQGKKILIGITGSIAAYKIPLLVRLLVKEGAIVKIIMTSAAANFVSPLTLSTLSKNEVLINLADNSSWANHVMLGRWADIMLLAPLSCNSLSKMASGLCDNLLMAVYLSATSPVVAAPAMDEDMWLHPSTQANISKVQSYGNWVIPVESGELASGIKGEGRMAEPSTILQWLSNFFTTKQLLKGKTAMVTAGPTYEAIDPVRFIGNRSSGKMGAAIAEVLYQQGAAVTLILGPSSVTVNPGIQTIRVTSAQEMFDAAIALFPSCDIAVMSAAVADYTAAEVAVNKIKKTDEEFNITLKKTKDILRHVGTQKRQGQIVVGFALETNNEKAFALKKLHEKNADLIVLNSLNDKGAGFGHDTNKITIFDRNGGEQNFEVKSKQAVAADIVNAIININQ